MFPQAPQLLAFEFASTHTPPQSVCPGGHDVAQVPFTQIWPGGQVLPHAPQ
jgi:hypothetical protein